MAHYALLDKNNVVTQVFVGKDENQEIDWEIEYGKIHNCICKRTSYNTVGGIHYDQTENGAVPSQTQEKAFRKNYAGIGFYYDEARDAFIEPQLHKSWILDETSCLWRPPVAKPSIGYWIWNEKDKIWVDEPQGLVHQFIDENGVKKPL